MKSFDKAQFARVWKTRLAFVYGFGVWTVIGLSFYCGVISNPMTEQQEKEKEEEKEGEVKKFPTGNEMGHFTSISEDGLKETTVYRTRMLNYSCIATHKPNFVPFTTRLHNYVQSFFDDSARKEK